jgi:lipid A 3-O-deacylase
LNIKDNNLRNKMKKLSIILFVILFSGVAIGGEYNYPNTWLKFGWDNDVIFQTDRYYTNGIRISYISKNHGHAFIDFLHLKNTYKENAYYSYSLSQDIFTPKNKNSTSLLVGDRPFSSSLLLSSNKIITNPAEKLIKQSEFQIGVIGKLGGGEWVQNGIHSLLPTSNLVTGWENQTETNFALNYGLEFEKLLTGNSIVHLSGILGSKLGLPYTYGETGVSLRLGNVHKYFSNLNLYSNRNVDVFVYSGIKGRLVGYNATIQGSLFSDADLKLSHPDINHFLYEVDTGINVAYRSIRLNLGVKYMSPEIETGDSHRWGYISFMFAL